MKRGKLTLLFSVVAVTFACATCGQDRTPVVATNSDAKQEAESCVEPSEGPIGVSAAAQGAETQAKGQVQVVHTGVRPGDAAPDFEAAAFVEGGFKNIKLSDYKGKWVVLCFYPGDFTFV